MHVKQLLAVVAGCTVGISAAAYAQGKAKPATPAMPPAAAKPAMPAARAEHPRVESKGEVVREEQHESMAAKKHEAGGKSVEERHEAMAARKHEEEGNKAEAERAKTVRTAGKKEDKAENRAFASAERMPNRLLHNIKVTKTERTQITAIEKKYREQITDLRHAEEANEKAGKPADAAIASRIQSLMDQERAELRGVLTSSQQKVFDQNSARVKP
ncbi:MAG TPA: hypothetical protein VF929_07530 [Gemmatimonadaceae bacterium]